ARARARTTRSIRDGLRNARGPYPSRKCATHWSRLAAAAQTKVASLGARAAYGRLWHSRISFIDVDSFSGQIAYASPAIAQESGDKPCRGSREIIVCLRIAHDVYDLGV